MKEGSLNSFANHAPKLEWVKEFFDSGDEFWDINGLGPNQVPMFKRFLRETGLIDQQSKTTPLFTLAADIGWEANVIWGILMSNFVYNPQIKWYINNLDIGMYYTRENVSELLMAEDVKKNDATSIINAYRRFSELPIGTSLGMFSVIEKKRQIDSLLRSKAIISDNLVVLYSLYLFAEKCNNYKEFTLAWLMNDMIDRDGISPTKLFGLDYEEMKSALLGLTAKYSEYIDATFTNDLDKITIKDKSLDDVLNLVKEAY